METNRRDFIKKTILGAGLVSTGLVSCTNSQEQGQKIKVERTRAQAFNMSGYAAPKLETVRIGIIGLGMRGRGAVRRMCHIDGVEIVAVCDKLPERTAKQLEIVKEKGLPAPKNITGTEEAWKAVCEDPDIDLVYICTPWEWHTPMAVYAMENGKHTTVEVPAAKTLDECWQLVETSERTKKHCMMLENACYDFFELQILNMVRQGYFGEIIHCEGAYIHDLRSLNFAKNGYVDMWRLKENATRNGNLYPTHGLGPVCQVLNINRGDKMDYLTAMQSDDFHMGKLAKEKAAEDNFYDQFVGKDYRGNMNTTVIRTIKGKTIMLHHDVTSPRPYSRIHLVSGTKGVVQKYPLPGRIATEHEWFDEAEMKKLEEQYTPELVKLVRNIAEQVGGHGGIDFIMDWRLIDCLRNGLPLDQDVYDAALWSSIGPLSEWSVANRSNSIDVPDFTCGSWQHNTPVSLSLKGGATTKARNLGEADSSKQLRI